MTAPELESARRLVNRHSPFGASRWLASAVRKLGMESALQHDFQAKAPTMTKDRFDSSIAWRYLFGRDDAEFAGTISFSM